MKKVLRWIVFAGVLLFAAAMVYSTWKGDTLWYFRVNGSVLIDGHKTSGYMHANTARTLLLLTRTDGARPETYLVSLGDQRAVNNCGEWYPLRFLPMPVSHVNPPCSARTVDAAKVGDPAIVTTLARGKRFVEFSTVSGKKVRGEW